MYHLGSCCIWVLEHSGSWEEGVGAPSQKKEKKKKSNLFLKLAGETRKFKGCSITLKDQAVILWINLANLASIVCKLFTTIVKTTSIFFAGWLVFTGSFCLLGRICLCLSASVPSASCPEQAIPLVPGVVSVEGHLSKHRMPGGSAASCYQLGAGLWSSNWQLALCVASRIHFLGCPWG